MKSPKLDPVITQFEGNPDPVIDAGHPKYVPHPLVFRQENFDGSKTLKI